MTETSDRYRSDGDLETECDLCGNRAVRIEGTDCPKCIPGTMREVEDRA